MKKDWTVWGGCIGLFLSWGVYFNILPKVTWAQASITDFVGGLTAIAAAVAAWASWRAATIAKRSAEDNKAFSRAQLYISHRADFGELLGYVAKELQVIFYRKNELYKKLFPNNHYSGEVFDSKGSEEVFDSWKAQYAAIIERTEKPLSNLEFYDWISDCIDILSEMHYEHARPDEPQICFWAFMEYPVATGFTSSPARHVFNMSEVMSRIRVFCGRDEIEPCLLEGQAFEAHYKLYYENIRSGHKEHYVGMPGEPMIPSVDV